MTDAANAAVPAIDTPDWASIVAVTLGIAAFGMALGLTYPLISLILTDRGYGETIVGANAASMALGLATATFIIPRLTAMLPAARLVVGSLCLAAAAILGFALFPSLAAWFGLRFMLGFCINVVFVLGEAWLNAACTEAMRGRVASVYTAVLSVSFAIGPLGVPAFGKESGFGFAAGATLVALIAISFAVLTRRARVRPEPAPPGSLLRFARAAPHLVLMVGVFAFVDAAAISLLPVYFVEKGLSEGWAATTVTVLFLGVLGSMPIVGYALDRLNRRAVAAACALISALAALGLPLADAEAWLVWLLLFVLGGAFSGIYACALTGLGEEFKGGLLVAGSAMFALSYAAGGIVGPATVGPLMEAVGLEAVPVSFAVVLLATAAVLPLLRRRANRAN